MANIISHVSFDRVTIYGVSVSFTEEEQYRIRSILRTIVGSHLRNLERANEDKDLALVKKLETCMNNIQISDLASEMHEEESEIGSNTP